MELCLCKLRLVDDFGPVLDMENEARESPCPFHMSLHEGRLEIISHNSAERVTNLDHTPLCVFGCKLRLGLNCVLGIW